ncbi:MAG: helix-turn-helix transcriptional regulator, partial [Clostridia bacterium]|nr:helix-turn-helix transcriptional regulator [Clostridia bacterium]
FVVDFLCEPISVYDSEDLYSRLSMLYGAKDVILIHNKHRFYDMTENILCASPDSDSVVSAMRIAELLLSLSGEYEKLCSKNEDASDFHKNNSLSTSKKLDMLINANFYKENAQEIISECMFISSRQLDRISKKHYGMTLHQIINENRVIAAEKMLKKSNLSVEKIASQVGFSSRSVFYRAFEAKFGCSPTEYRKSK